LTILLFTSLEKWNYVTGHFYTDTFYLGRKASAFQHYLS